MLPFNAPSFRYEVRLTEPVEIEIDAHHARLSALVSEAFADRWQDALIDKISKLEFMPHIYPLAVENDLYNVEVRRLLYFGPSGRRNSGVTYRVLFRIVEPNPLDPEGIVRILHILHGAQKPTV